MAPGLPQRIAPKEVVLTSTGSWVGTVIFFAFSVGLFLLALFKIREFMAILIFGFFAAFGVAGVVLMIRAHSSQRRYGPMPLELEGPAPAVGGRLRASLELPAAATHTAAPLSLRAVLTCSKVIYGEKQSRMLEPLQGLHKVIAVARGPSGARATFDFDIPPDLPHADDPGLVSAILGKAYAEWELKVEALGDEVNLSRSYAIPVGRSTSAVMRGPAPAAPSVPNVPTMPDDGPIEIVRPAARSAGFAPPALPPTAPSTSVMSPVVKAAGKVEEPAPEILLPDDDRKSLWVLVAINLVPLAGVLFAGWRVHEVVFLYWIENLVIGAVNVLRMRIAVPENLASLQKRGVAPTGGEMFWAKAVLIGFFIVHYGAFCFGHGTFLASFFPPQAGGGRELGEALRAMLLNPATLVAILAIVLSHAYSYFHNYIGRGEYLRVDLQKLMFRPYKRIVVTHLFIFAGAFAMAGLGSPVAAMLAFIGLKTAIDGYAHLQERKQLAAQA